MMTKEEKNYLASIIYERYSVGEISLDEREDLLKELNNKYIKENTLVEDVEIDEDVLNKLNMFKEAVYDKYVNGEITLETREKLIARANEEFADMYMESDQVSIFKKKIDEHRRKNSHKRDEFKKKKMNKINNETIAIIKQIIEKNERDLKDLIFCYPHYTHIMRKDAIDALKKLRDTINDFDPDSSVEESKAVVDKYKKISEETKKSFKKYDEGIKGYMIEVRVKEFYKNLCEFAKHMTDDINLLEINDKGVYNDVTSKSKKIKDKSVYNALNSMYADYSQFSMFILSLYTVEISSYYRGINILNKYNKKHREHELTPEAQRIKNVDKDPVLNSLMKKGSKNKNGYYVDFTDDSNPKDSYTTRKYNLYTSDYDDHIKESAYERYYNGEISLDDFITEKATREQYRMKAFKKKYNYNPKDKSIIVDGEKYYVDLDVNKPMMKVKDVNGEEVTEIRKTSSGSASSEPTIYLDKTFFKLKNSGRRDAVLKHEIGHLKYHGKQNNGVNNYDAVVAEFIKSIKSEEEYNKKSYDELKRDGASKEELEEEKAYGDLAIRDIIKKELEKRGFTEDSFDISEIRKQRADIIADTRKYLDEKYTSKKHQYNQHSNSKEYEADTYATNHSSKSNLKKGLREENKYYKSDKNMKKIIDHENDINTYIKAQKVLKDKYNKDITSLSEEEQKRMVKEYKKHLEKTDKTKKKNEPKDLIYKDKKSINKVRKESNTANTDDYNRRMKALNDPKLKNSNVYK